MIALLFWVGLFVQISGVKAGNGFGHMDGPESLFVGLGVHGDHHRNRADAQENQNNAAIGNTGIQLGAAVFFSGSQGLG